MRVFLLLLCFAVASADVAIVSLAGDVQKAYSWSKLKVGDLLDETFKLEESPLWGGEIRLGAQPNADHRFYIGLELAHQRRGLKHYSAFAEYNFTPALNRHVRGIVGVGGGYSLAMLSDKNVTISGQSPGNLSFHGAHYFAKLGALLTISRNIEIEFFAKGKHMILGEDNGSITFGLPLPVSLNLDKTFTISGGVGLNFRF